VPVGTTGESATLSHNEHKEAIEIAIECCKNSSVKVVAGAGSNSTIEAIDLAQFAQKAGADAILSVTPYYNKPTQDGLYAHYKSIANSIEIPVMLYNVPGRTAVDLKPSTVKKLFDDVDNIYAIKEATGSIERVVELQSLVPNIDIISGDDAINYPILASGGKGVISVTANLMPYEVSQIVKLSRDGDLNAAKELNQKLFELNKSLFVESNPIPIKAIMYLAGLLDTLEYRLPLTPPSSKTMKRLEEVLTKYEVKGF
jgi:4-hydroxy-tetrahydrodipicolinate synthase